MPRGIPDCLTDDLADHATRAEIVALRALAKQTLKARDQLRAARELFERADRETERVLDVVRARAEAAKAPAQEEGGAA